MVGLDDQVQVIALDGVVDDAHAEALLRRAHRILDGLLAAEAAEEADGEEQAERDVNGMPRRKLRPAQVWHAGPLALRLAPGALPLSAPRRQLHH